MTGLFHKKRFLAVALACTALVSACSKTDSGNNATAAAGDSAKTDYRTRTALAIYDRRGKDFWVCCADPAGCIAAVSSDQNFAPVEYGDRKLLMKAFRSKFEKNASTLVSECFCIWLCPRRMASGKKVERSVSGA